MWYIIIPFAGGYAGRCGKGEVFGPTRIDVIKLLLNL